MFQRTSVRAGGFSHWYRRAYARPLTGILVAAALTFLATFPAREEIPHTIIRTRPVEYRAGPELATQALGFDVTAPVHVQFVEFTITRLVNPPIVAFVVGAGILTALLVLSRRA